MWNKKVDLPENPPQPDLTGEHPEIWKTGIVEKVQYVAGKGKVSSDCMVLMSCLYDEDARDGIVGSYNKILKDPPAYLKCQGGAAMKDLINSCGIDSNNIYATSLIKWLLPKDHRGKPSSEELHFGAKFFKMEMEKIKPKLVICMGKPAFDFFCPYKFKADDVEAGVFWSKEYECYYVLVDPINVLHNKPFTIDAYKVNLKESISLLKETYGIDRKSVQLDYKVIYNSNELREFVNLLKAEQHKLLSVDCEWRGLNPWKGDLRSLQIAWAPGKAIYIRFMDDAGNYVFDIDYERAGLILKEYVDNPEVKFVGHHFAADGVWLEQILKINTYEKCYLDTEFASQCVDEHRALGLEQISMRYTDLGRYEIDLVLWKKQNPQGDMDGYGYIPDEIMFPYAMKDVDAVIRAVPFLVKELEEQNLSDYYFNYFNKFVTDVFIHFTTTGLLVDVGILNELRELYGFAKQKLELKFVELMAIDAERLLVEFLAPLGLPTSEALKLPVEVISMALNETPKRVEAMIKHYEHRHQFNFRSGDDMKRWLFDVKQFMPFKSTPQKEKGRPSTSWEKVLQMPLDQQKLYTPSADKQTLNIYAEQDPLVARLVGLNLVGNIFKMCLKPAELDDEGEVVRENGLFFFIGEDGYIRANFSSTETGRPRSWKPNILNLSGFVNKRIQLDISDMVKEYHQKGELPECLNRYLTEKIPSIRSCVKAPEGYCMVESDYKTAEIRALAFISGDENLIRIMTEPDLQFALIQMGEDKVAIRLKYDENCGIPFHNQKEEYIGHLVNEGEIIRKVEESEFLRDKDGNLLHPDADLHWSLVEFMNEIPRESMEKKKHRDGIGKPGNFSCLPASTMVLTQFGEIPILNLNSDLHKLWDGISWVSYEGIISKGKQEVFEYAGLRATADHGVWVEDGREVYFGEAILNSHKLSKTMGADYKAKLVEFCTPRGNYESGPQEKNYLPSRLQSLWKDLCKMVIECGKRIWTKLQLSEKNRSYSLQFKNKIQKYVTAVQSLVARKFPQLQRSWNTGIISRLQEFCGMGTCYISRRELQGKGFRQGGQRWTLLPRQPSISNTKGESEKYENFKKFSLDTSQEFHGVTPRGGPKSSYCEKLNKWWKFFRKNIQRLVGRKHKVTKENPNGKSRSKEEMISALVSFGYTFKVEEVYDLVNAGPNKRYTANGVLVSNTSYGASSSSLERKIYADSGIMPELGTGERIFKALEKRQGRAVEYLEEQQLAPSIYPFITAASGRRRHFLGTNDKSMGFKERKSLMSSQGREARNFPMQESVGATAQRACIWLIEQYKKLGLKAKVMICLYDALVTVCPIEERHIVAKLHELYMCVLNTWEYHGRVMNYPIDTEFVFRWSDKKKSQKELELLN